MKDGELGVIRQRDRSTFAIAPHLPCGLVSPDQLRTIADTADKYQCKALKVTSAARIAMIGFVEDDVAKVWNDLGVPTGHAVGLCVRSIKACPGNSHCRLGQQDALSVGLLLDERYHGMPLPSKTKIGISGCNNQCAENCIKDIGLTGKKKGWRVTIGGNGASRPRLADTIAEDLDTEAALALVDRVVDFYRDNAKKHERIGRMIDRLGLDVIKAEVL